MATLLRGGVIYLSEKQYRILHHCSQHKTFINDIAKKKDVTYSHAHKIILAFVSMDLVKVKKSGRRKYIMITDRGRKIVEHYQAILKLMRGSEW